MNILLVVDRRQDWPDDTPGITILSAHAYLSTAPCANTPSAKVLNLCKDHRYQGEAYYVSLLAEARGQQAFPAPDAMKAAPGHTPRHAREEASHALSLAILHDPQSAQTPSNAHALDKFRAAAESLGMRAELMTPQQVHRLPAFDALFIRATTNVNHYTYRLSRQAAEAGMVVIDEPRAILCCTNKVYLHELFSRHGIPTPRTVIFDGSNIDSVVTALGFPCVLKQPDGAFSAGVNKICSLQELRLQAAALFAHSALALAQEYLPTDFDWRIAVLDRKPLFACKYHMADGHWQIIQHEAHGMREGRTEAVPLDAVPVEVIDIALRAANLIGDGFYGVDLKEAGGRFYVMEINDNPSVDAGHEDALLQDALYREVMQVFRRRIEIRRTRRTGRLR